VAPRPRKTRRLGWNPRPAIYKPVGVPLDQLAQVTLLAEEVEALRLADLLDLSQSEAAARMAVSRPTFQRILASAHRSVAQALVEGCALRLEGVTISPPPPRRGAP
jgi:predicted DNA-binding protein (UPF0251 family)